MTETLNRYSVVFIPTLYCDCLCDYCFSRISNTTVSTEMWSLILNRFEEFTREEGVDHLVFYWLGGELFTQSPDYYRGCISSLRERLPDVKIEHHFQSNLLHYDSVWGDFLKDQGNSRISSSMDYPNLYRYSSDLDRDEYVETWIKKKSEAERDGLEVSVITLPNEQTLETDPHEFYSFFRNDLKVPKFQINLPFRGGNVNHSIELDMTKLISFMTELYKIWIADNRSIYFAPFSYIESYLLEGRENFTCVFAYTCGEKIIALSPTGDVVPCDYWVTAEDKISYGNIRDFSFGEILKSPVRQEFLDRPAHLVMDSSCGECEYWGICHGGCPIRAVSFHDTLHTGDYYCSLYRAIFKAVNSAGNNCKRGKKLETELEKKKFTDFLFDGII